MYQWLCDFDLTKELLNKAFCFQLQKHFIYKENVEGPSKAENS